MYTIWLSVSFELWFDKFERAMADILRPAMNLFLAVIIILNIAGVCLGILAIHRRERYIEPALVGITLNAIPLVIATASAIFG